MIALFNSAKDAAAPVIDHLPAIGISLLVVVVLVCTAVAEVIKRHQRWKNYREKRGWKPASWFKAEPKIYFDIENELLSNKGLVDSAADINAFLTPKEDGGSTWKPAWLSPHSRPVRAMVKAHRGAARGKRYLVHQHVAEAAKYFVVRELPETHRVVELEPSKIPEGETPKQKLKRERKEERKLRENHFRIDIVLDGRDPAEVRRLEGKIVSQLGLKSLQEFETEDNFTLSYAAHKSIPGDPLMKLKAGIEFFRENAAKVAHLIPLAVRENGKLWALAMHHLLIIGMTGSGKGSPLNGLIRQLAPFVERGTAVFYGIDPKASELRPYEESRLFEELVYENAGAVDVIAEVHKVMKHRAKHKRVDVENADLGRSLDATRENPMVVLFIDEFLSLLIALQAMGKPGKAATTLLVEVLAQGRSLGVYVVAATQEADKDLLGRMRGNFANIILLKQPSEYFNDFFLGEGARAAGFDSTAIPLSTKANGYAYAGIGFVKEETGKPVKVRFAYSSDEDIAELIKTYPKVGRSTPAQAIAPTYAIGDDDADTGGFDYEPLVLHESNNEGGGFGRF
ncbi:FtsK/SpoIIIE domain-containing protein [Frigoribacterium sp. SL97]|uniref:FtsK/SpoIIIE domain-containing protein n=1 Tax=Frigoribacterium sp. SL97 TaxID=2994664 RepID=UPI002271CDDB|nr:FtsK/SpoIIIE domain-containing protein [Frigoribacterium sp. SL97]WAC53232.1 FtsK/SpoIIIE domain-containing protein [Frigoribacterium sp. SL97]